MGKLAIGDVVSCVFPFSDLSSQKFRPALVVAKADFDNVILCQITSKAYSSSSPVVLSSDDFAEGNLPITSYIRPDKLFTAEASIVSQVYGKVAPAKMNNVLATIRMQFESTPK